MAQPMRKQGQQRGAHGGVYAVQPWWPVCWYVLPTQEPISRPSHSLSLHPMLPAQRPAASLCVVPGACEYLLTVGPGGTWPGLQSGPERDRVAIEVRIAVYQIVADCDPPAGAMLPALPNASPRSGLRHTQCVQARIAIWGHIPPAPMLNNNACETDRKQLLVLSSLIASVAWPGDTAMLLVVREGSA